MADGLPAATAGLRALVLAAADAPSLAGAIAHQLTAAGGQVRTAPRGEAADVAIAAAAGALGGLDAVIHLAAPSRPRPFLERDDASWAAELDARIGEPVRVARAAAPVLAADGGGAIVFLGTLDAFHAYAGHADASLAMGALAGLVRTLALELAPLGVRANAVLAGPLEPDASDAPDPALAARTLLRSPSHRFVTPAEVASAVAFAAGPASAFMSGSTLRVDGGWASLNQSPDGMRFP